MEIFTRIKIYSIRPFKWYRMGRCETVLHRCRRPRAAVAPRAEPTDNGKNPAGQRQNPVTRHFKLDFQNSIATYMQNQCVYFIVTPMMCCVALRYQLDLELSSWICVGVGWSFWILESLSWTLQSSQNYSPGYLSFLSIFCFVVRYFCLFTVPFCMKYKIWNLKFTYLRWHSRAGVIKECTYCKNGESKF